MRCGGRYRWAGERPRLLSRPELEVAGLLKPARRIHLYRNMVDLVAILEPACHERWQGQGVGAGGGADMKRGNHGVVGQGPGMEMSGFGDLRKFMQDGKTPEPAGRTSRSRLVPAT